MLSGVEILDVVAEPRTIARSRAGGDRETFRVVTDVKPCGDSNSRRGELGICPALGSFDEAGKTAAKRRYLPGEMKAQRRAPISQPL